MSDEKLNNIVDLYGDDCRIARILSGNIEISITGGNYTIREAMRIRDWLNSALKATEQSIKNNVSG